MQLVSFASVRQQRRFRNSTRPQTLSRYRIGLRSRTTSIPISLTGGKFASDKMVITYTNNSQFAHEINASNWYEILTMPGVAVGRSDPDADPSGYRTLMVWKLAQRYYNRTTLYDGLAQNAPDKYIRHQEVDLISSLKSGEIDYAWN